MTARLANCYDMRLFRKSKVCKAVHFIYEYARRSRRSADYKRVYRCLAKRIGEFEKSRGITVYSNTFTDSVAEDFIDFMKDRGLLVSTIKGYMAKIGFMFSKMAKRGYEVDWTFQDIILEDEDPITVYITSEEIERIYEMNIKTKERELIRDMFVANCLIGMRFGDFKKLTNKNISGDTIVRRTNKTGAGVRVPVHRIVRDILNKYNGFPPYEKSDQNYNKVVKNICKQAGLNDKVLWERTVGHNIVRKTYKRYELVGSHTARRSFATNAYVSGIPVARIMLITGHKTESSFFKYIRIEKKENAEVLADHPFFN